MKKPSLNKCYLIVCLLLAGGLTACDDDGGDDPGDATEEETVAASDVFPGSFSVTATGPASAADFDGTTITFSVSGTNINYTMEGGSPSAIVFPSEGSYTYPTDADFSDGNAVTITREIDNLPTTATFSQEGQQLVLQFTIPDTPNGKTLGVPGAYTFTLNK